LELSRKKIDVQQLTFLAEATTTSLSKEDEQYYFYKATNTCQYRLVE